MYCPTCGTANGDNDWKCIKCGAGLHPNAPPAPYPPAVPNYLSQAVLVTIFCCVPLGIPAIVYAAQVNAKLKAGDIQGAVDSSNKAKMWAWIAFGLGLGGVTVYAIAAVISAIAGN